MSMLKSGKLQSLPDVDGECLLDTVMSVLHFSLKNKIAGPYYGGGVPRVIQHLVPHPNNVQISEGLKRRFGV